MTQQEHFELYGKILDGTETNLDLQKLMRTRYLKLKMRDKLAADIGDDPDALTDVLRCVLVAQAINIGIITDPVIIARHAQYIGEMLAGYGGAENIMDVLEYDKDRIEHHVVAGYFAAKEQISLAETAEDIMAIDLPE